VLSDFSPSKGQAPLIGRLLCLSRGADLLCFRGVHDVSEALVTSCSWYFKIGSRNGASFV